MQTNIFATFLALMLLVTPAVHAQDKYAGFPDPQADFHAHILEVERYLLDKQMSQRSASDVQFNLPFERKADTGAKYRGKFFLVHGLNDSPFVFRDVADELVQRGFDVRAILLPGHGSSPEAQLNTSSRQWLKFAKEQLQHWNQDDVPMYLGGFSMGSVISTTLALEADQDIAGLLLFSPAFKSSMNGLLRWASLYAKFKPWVFGGMIIEDNPTKYNSIPVNGAAQYYNLIKNLKKTWGSKKLGMPVLAVASLDDSVVDVNFFIQLFNKKFTSEHRHLIVYSNAEAPEQDARIDFRTSSFPDLRVLNQSHQGVLIAPDNPLFGAAGSILVCNGNDWETFSGCLYSDENHWFGAQNTPSPDNIPVARTTYNPEFYGVFDAFDEVFQVSP